MKHSKKSNCNNGRKSRRRRKGSATVASKPPLRAGCGEDCGGDGRDDDGHQVEAVDVDGVANVGKVLVEPCNNVLKYNQNV